MQTKNRIDFSVRQDYSVRLMSTAELRALSSTIGDSGGYIVQQSGIVSALEASMISANVMQRVSTLLRTDTGEDLQYPLANDTDVEGSWIADTALSPTLDDAEFGALKLSAHPVNSGLVVISNALIEDASVDVESVIGQLLGERLARAVNRAATVGAAAGRPTGIVSMSMLGKTAASATAISLPETKDLAMAVDAAYRDAPTAGYMMHSSVWSTLLDYLDGTNQWPTSVIASGPVPRLWGYRVFMNDAMPDTIEASAKTIVFGDLSKYILRTVRDAKVRVMPEVRGEYNQNVLMAFLRVDGGLLVPDASNAPCAYLQQAAA